MSTGVTYHKKYDKIFFLNDETLNDEKFFL